MQIEPRRFLADRKWQGYLDWCDRFFWAVDADFPTDLLPDETGLILADSYGAEIVRMGPETPLAGARRKALMRAFARNAALRLQALRDPGVSFACAFFGLCLRLAAHGARGLGGGAQFLGDFLGLLGLEVERQFDPLGLDIDAHHAEEVGPICRSGGNVALLVDAHGLPPSPYRGLG